MNANGCPFLTLHPLLPHFPYKLNLPPHQLHCPSSLFIRPRCLRHPLTQLTSLIPSRSLPPKSLNITIVSVNAWFGSDSFLHSSSTIHLLAPFAHHPLLPHQRVNRLLRHLPARLLRLHTILPIHLPRPFLLANWHNVSVDSW